MQACQLSGSRVQACQLSSPAASQLSLSCYFSCVGSTGPGGTHGAKIANICPVLGKPEVWDIGKPEVWEIRGASPSTKVILRQTESTTTMTSQSAACGGGPTLALMTNADILRHLPEFLHCLRPQLRPWGHEMKFESFSWKRSERITGCRCRAPTADEMVRMVVAFRGSTRSFDL